MTIPILYAWTGTAMEPLKRFHNAVNALFVIGQVYNLEVIEERSSASHRHYFASLHDAWLNLPEDQAERFATSEHLRKFALIKTGFADSRQMVCSSKAEAIRFAAFVRPCDEYALVTVAGQVVTIYTAQSQSTKAMGKKRFQESKDAVLEYVSSLIGVDPRQLAHNAGKAA